MVVMATFNGVKYVAEQLASLRDQTMPPCRLIVRDDGSSNTTRELASFDKKADFDVVVLDGPQRGYAENFWSTAKFADTKYPAWADQDDLWHPARFRDVYELWRKRVHPSPACLNDSLALWLPITVRLSVLTRRA
jgi:GT2 family glycosyltransferase